MQCAGFQSILQASDIPGFGDIPSNIEQLQLLLQNNYKFFFVFLLTSEVIFFSQAKPACEHIIMLHVFVSLACKAYCYTFNLPNL